ncbi:MAG: hypothetical protein AAF802_29490 [Planctomycetota bacterium]
MVLAFVLGASGTSNGQGGFPSPIPDQTLKFPDPSNSGQYIKLAGLWDELKLSDHTFVSGKPSAITGTFSTGPFKETYACSIVERLKGLPKKQFDLIGVVGTTKWIKMEIYCTQKAGGLVVEKISVSFNQYEDEEPEEESEDEDPCFEHDDIPVESTPVQNDEPDPEPELN